MKHKRGDILVSRLNVLYLVVGNGRCVVPPTGRQRSELPLIFQYKILSTEKCFDQDGCLL